MLNKYLVTKRAKGRNTPRHVLLSKLTCSAQEDVPARDNVRNIFFIFIPSSYPRALKSLRIS